MSSDYSYDEQGQFFPVFILVLTGLATLPLTYSLLKPSSDSLAGAARVRSDYTVQDADLLARLRQAQKRRQRRTKRLMFAVVGWALMALMAYLIMSTSAPELARIWNPYDILGISESATEAQIKKAYKTLSARLHPDKIKPDPAKNETIQTLNDRYVEVGKAYRALTDDVVRANYIQFGHPDGKQSVSIGIALPKFMVSDGNGKYVVLLYALLLGVLLPYTVGSWWYGTQRLSKEGVLMESANNLFREYDDEMDAADIVGALSSGKEFEKLIRPEKADHGLAGIEKRLLPDGETNPGAGLKQKDQQKLEEMDSGVRRKALALLWAYLGRIKLDDAGLESLKYESAPIALRLTQSFFVIAQVFGSTGPLLECFKATQYLVQAISPGRSPLLQLPHFTPAVARRADGNAKNPTTVQQFMALPESERRSRVVGAGLLTEAQYQTALGVARQLPYFSVAKAFFKVAGERIILPSSLVTLVVKGRFIPPGSGPAPEIDELELEDVDPAEDDVEALTGRKKRVLVKGPDGKPVKVNVAEEKPVPAPLAYAPLFPRDVSPRWHVFLTDSKQGRLAVPPTTFTAFDKAGFDPATGKPTFAVQTLKCQFAAPPQPGAYTFVLHVVCDAYVGLDSRLEVTLRIDEASSANAVAAEDEISEPDEDTLAGQMRALKQGAAAGDDDEDDDESGTEEEADTTSDTNTDTDEE